MLTSRTIHNSGNRGLGNAKSFGDLPVREFLSRSQLFDGGDIVRRKFSVAKRHDAGLDGVGMISNSGNPFKVGVAIVGFVRVAMVDLWKIIRVWDECSGNKSVNRNVATKWGASEVDRRVTTVVRVSAQHLSFEGPAPNNSYARANHLLLGSVQTPAATEVADLVKMGKLRNWNRAPLLNIGHLILSLSQSMSASLRMALAAPHYNRRLQFR